MVRTGRRVEVLADALVAGGLKHLRGSTASTAPRLSDLSVEVADELSALYRSLGGLQDQPGLRPGAWDLVFQGPLLIELDEELHFNRYRGQTLTASWESGLPWRDSYCEHCVEHEATCLAAGAWGKRWTNDSAGRMFSGGAVGELGGEGAPRWKQRALYDAMKDAVVGVVGVARLSRVATHDRVGTVTLGSILDGVAPIDIAGIRALIEARTA